MNKETVFPVDSSSIVMTRGMTLRDYFAAHAMQGFAADPDVTWEHGLKDMAKYAYAWADAMLAERDK